MYPTMITALGADRIREWHEQAARDRLVSQARRARRAAAPVAAGRPRQRRGFRWARRAVAPAAGLPDQRTPAAVAATDERVVADGRQPVGGRAA